MSSENRLSIGGGWLGTYSYGGSQNSRPPTRFEATFAAPDREGHFMGTILDDGKLGEAHVSGMQQGRSVSFTKAYIGSSPHPVLYEGTLSEDGKFLNGTWRINARAHGVWDAHRLWSAQGMEEKVLEEAEADRERQLIVVR